MINAVGSGATFEVLFVCTGNICRSPLAERLFRDRAGAPDLVRTASAGTAAMVGHPIDARSARALRELGIDPDGHVARRLTARMITDADLILTAEGGHRSVILQSDPMAYRRVFTLLEFARLGESIPAAEGPVSVVGLRARVGEIADRRGQVEPVRSGAEDIADPYGAPIDAARICAAEIAAGVSRSIASLLPRRSA